MASSMTRVLAGLALATILVAFPGCHGPSNPGPASPTEAPVLTVVMPSQALVGDTITLTGSGFTASDNAIKIGAGYIQGVVSSRGTSLSFTLPAVLIVCPPWSQVCITLAILVTPGTYQVSVITANGTSNELPLVVVAK
jgi:hypothetical protein